MTAKELQVINFLHYLSTHPWIIALIYVVGIWSIIWKGIALWRAGRNNQMAWFIVMLIFNTVGILEIVYLFFFSKPKNKNI